MMGKRTDEDVGQEEGSIHCRHRQTQTLDCSHQDESLSSVKSPLTESNRTIHHHTTVTDISSSPEPDEDSSDIHTNTEKSHLSSEPFIASPGLHPIALTNKTVHQSVSLERSRQARLLLVSLLDNFCQMYERHGTKHKQLFLELCRQLSYMGILESTDFVDEMAHVRSAYKSAFRELVLQALQSIKNSPVSSPSRRLTFPMVNSLTSSESVAIIEGYRINEFRLNLFRTILEEKPLLSEFLLLKVSRYEDEFEELARLGTGAFGTVFRVRNRLDRGLYAIKKVRLKRLEAIERTLREVKALARLDHVNVVRYHSAWIEDESLLALKSERKFLPTLEETTNGTLGSWTEDATLQSNAEGALQKNMILYIQMQLCQATLHDWLVARNERFFSLSNLKSSDQGMREHLSSLIEAALVAGDDGSISGINASENVRIFRHIVHGLRYIHARGLLHRDLKPMNLFFLDDEAIVPKIGDLGLVTGRMDALERDESSPEHISAREYTQDVGTTTYAAPEQLLASGFVLEEDESAPPHPSVVMALTSAVDVYSLGIIFFELFHPFSTAMERVITLNKLRTRHVLPESFVQQWPKEAAFVLWCTERDPGRRPSCDEILSFELFSTRNDEIVSHLEQMVLERQREISRLRAQLDRLMTDKANLRVTTTTI